ncbi:ABC transporter ATP-binding protein [Fusibacter sp. 3D3]|uniref:ABC transporter ATP-binding protein n=1 Tax=Fusibacter sp. 3D3 TaxID=1048380 RepID=UPI00085922D5|nr:ATP-binding cassette domain-containing protein [Fusibacter sp. 3D3]GAU78796.1 nitrate ABC transporter, ATP-binding protein nrtC-2 [Fusibacter sp. 3D3]
MLKIENVSKNYGNGPIFESISMHVKRSEILSVVGPSGSGKSTLLNIMSGILEATEGVLITEAKRLSYVFQEDRLLPWITLKENILFVKDNISDDDLTHLIDMLGLAGAEDKYPAALSGGMRQRAAIARAFAYEPDLLLMDEPFKSIDYYLKSKIIEALIKVWEERTTTVVFVTHDIDEAILMADRILVLGDKPTRIIKEISIEHPRAVSEREQLNIRKRIKECWEEI